jgi:hypothetical protein
VGQQLTELHLGYKDSSQRNYPRDLEQGGFGSSNMEAGPEVDHHVEVASREWQLMYVRHHQVGPHSRLLRDSQEGDIDIHTHEVLWYETAR